MMFAATDIPKSVHDVGTDISSIFGVLGITRCFLISLISLDREINGLRFLSPPSESLVVVGDAYVCHGPFVSWI